MLFYWLQFLFVSGFLIQIIPPKVSQESTYTATESTIYAFFEALDIHQVKKEIK